MERKPCPVCGAQIPSLAGYCPECGAELREKGYERAKKSDPADDPVLELDAEETYPEDLDEIEYINIDREVDEDEYVAPAAARGSRETGRRAASSRRAPREDDDYDRDRGGGGGGKLVPVFIILCGILLALIGVVAQQFLKRSSRNVVTVNTSAAAVTKEEMTQTTAAPAGTTVALETTAAETTLEETTEETSAEETSPMETTEEETTEEETTEEETTEEKTTKDPLEDATPMYTTTALNLRSAAGTGSSVLAVIPEMAKIQVIRKEGSWYLVSYNGQQGYVSAKYVAGSRAEAESMQESREEESRKEESKKKETEESKKKETKEEETTKAKKKGSGSDDSYILRNSSKTYLTADDISGLSKKQLRLARNEIYARHGYIFSDSSLQEYFEGKSWYKGTTKGSDFDDSVLNKYETANLKLIRGAE